VHLWSRREVGIDFYFNRLLAVVNFKEGVCDSSKEGVLAAAASGRRRKNPLIPSAPLLAGDGRAEPLPNAGEQPHGLHFIRSKR